MASSSIVKSPLAIGSDDLRVEDKFASGFDGSSPCFFHGSARVIGIMNNRKISDQGRATFDTKKVINPRTPAQDIAVELALPNAQAGLSHRQIQKFCVEAQIGDIRSCRLSGMQ